MLHHYSYTHFLSYHQQQLELEQQQAQGGGDAPPADAAARSGPKSTFTIAAILGLSAGATASGAPHRQPPPPPPQPPPTRRAACKSKRVRTIFTPEQLERLEAEFERQQYMVGPERLYLAHTLQLTEAQVKVWFQNRRIKWRKHHLELTHQRLAALKQQQQQQQQQQQLQMLLHDHDSHSSASET